MTTSQRWKNRPEGSNWGDFGPDDQLGRLNLLTPEKVRQGVAEVREGLAFCLSLPLDYPGGNILNPRRHPPALRPTVRNGRPNMNYRLGDDDPDVTDVICDDLVILHTQYSTQWDSLAHVGQLFDADGDGKPEALYYNGFRPDEHVRGPSDPKDAGGANIAEARSTSEAQALGIEKMAETCVQGRGVLIDLHARVGRERVAVGYDLLMSIMEADGVEVESGDMVCLHTGFGQLLLEMGRKPDPASMSNACAVLNGRDGRLLNWITDSGLAALIADNYAVEAHPAVNHSGCCASLPLHEHCLFKLGIHLGELWLLTPLADWLRSRKRHRFLLTAPPCGCRVPSDRPRHRWRQSDGKIMPITSSPLNAIQKACGILRALSAKAPLRLSEITAAAGLNKVTTLRILDTLVQEGFVRRLDDEASYVLGPEIQAMIAPLQQPSDIREMARPSLVRLATLSEDTVLLSVRSGNESVCIDREVGVFPIRANYLDFGSRRPLGVGAGSLALLAWAQDREIDAVLEALAPQLQSYPRMTPEIIKAEVATAREQGYTLLCDKVVDGMAAIGIPVFQGSNRVPMAAISIAALTDRIRTRVPELLEGLRREAEFIARAFDLPATRAPSRPSQRRKAK